MKSEPTKKMMNRRGLMQATGAGALLAVMGESLAKQEEAEAMPASSTYLDIAERAAQWINASRIDTAAGVSWPRFPETPNAKSFDLYHGSAGVILFFLEFYQVTGKRAYLQDAISGADHLLSLVDGGEISSQSLYFGLGGVGYCLEEVHKSSGLERFRHGSVACFDRIIEKSHRTEHGLAWSDIALDGGVATDVTYGSAGNGLALLYAADAQNHKKSLDVAKFAGDHLLQASLSAEIGKKWPMTPTFPRMMPNFSHGTSGVGYFLARLYKATGEKKYLDGALAAGEYLKSVATCKDDSCLIFHDEPVGKDLYYLSWCHGPAGTSRLYYELDTIALDGAWFAQIERAVGGIIDTGAPQRRTPGFWNNVSQCCGDAGVGEFLISLHKVSGKRKYWDYALMFAEYLKSSASTDQQREGLRWIQAEDRPMPNVLSAQTGWMQGAAGIGAFFLHLYAELEDKKTRIVFPDSPWIFHS